MVSISRARARARRMISLGTFIRETDSFDNNPIILNQEALRNQVLGSANSKKRQYSWRNITDDSTPFRGVI